MAGTTYPHIEDITYALAQDLAEQGWSHLQTGIDPKNTAAQQDLFTAMDTCFSGVDARPMERASLIPRVNAPTHATSDKEMDFHTDNAYLPNPCGAIALFCIAPAQVGGHNQLLDGLAIVDSLPPEARQELRTSQWRWKDPATIPMEFSPELPIIYSRSDGADAIRWWRKGVAAHASAMALLDSVKQSVDIAGKQAVTVSLKPGDLLLTDNTRVLHNRSAFEGPRHIERVRFWQ